VGDVAGLNEEPSELSGKGHSVDLETSTITRAIEASSG
jgi:hypothetical protein